LARRDGAIQRSGGELPGEQPGTVVIAPSTRRLTGGLFDYEDLGAVEIEGLETPVPAR
jgi:hypothetical protein